MEENEFITKLDSAVKSHEVPRTSEEVSQLLNVPIKQVLTNKKPVFAKIKLFKNHIHSGILYMSGTVIEVDEPSLRYIEDHNIGTRV